MQETINNGVFDENSEEVCDRCYFSTEY